jgi:hypothetical protein
MRGRRADAPNSLELFNRSTYEAGDGVVRDHCERAATSFQRLQRDFGF